MVGIQLHPKCILNICIIINIWIFFTDSHGHIWDRVDLFGHLNFFGHLDLDTFHKMQIPLILLVHFQHTSNYNEYQVCNSAFANKKTNKTIMLSHQCVSIDDISLCKLTRRPWMTLVDPRSPSINHRPSSSLILITIIVKHLLINKRREFFLLTTSFGWKCPTYW